MKTFMEWLAEVTQATIYTQSGSKGASVDDTHADEQPVMLNIDDILNYEQAGKMQQPKSQKHLAALVAAIRKGETSYFLDGEERQITPILVRQADNTHDFPLRGVSNPRWNGRTMTSAGGVPNSQYKYQVVDGHHRYWAYKAAGFKQVPAVIIPPENIRREKFYIPPSP